ncbi:Fic family protein, partial [Escherichia coli]|nr:Fic family protein [Escherichia coli]
MAIKSPPGLIPLSHLSGEELLAHLRFNRVTDEKGRYLPFDELQYRIKK